MADPISAIIAAAKAIAAAVASFAAAHPIVWAGLKIVASVALGAAMRPDIPKPEAGKFTIRQARPPRRYGVGRCRVSGPFLFLEARGAVLHQVIALPEGPVASFGRFWFNDDEIQVVNNVVQELTTKKGAYANGKVRLYTRKGHTPETPYAELMAEFPGIWTANHRGDGMPTLYARCQHGKVEYFNKLYPNARPEPSTEAFYAAYDWRNPAHDRNDPDTWTFTGNPVVWAVNVLWRRFGAEWDARFAPALDLLTIEADYCDQLVPLKNGGTEKRYECGFFYESTNPAGQVLGVILDSMDGWFGQRADGAYIIRAGRYVTPTVVIGDEEIIDIEFDPGPLPEERVDILSLAYCSPAHDYSEIEVAPWILDTGNRVETFYPQAVQSPSQVRRLGKRKRLNAARGRMRTRLSARRGLGERFVGINCTDVEELTNGAVEILDAEVDLASDSITWTFAVADPNIDAWDPATEEGDGPLGTDRPDPVDIGVPVILSHQVVFQPNGTSGYSARAQLFLQDLNRDDLKFVVRWRIQGGNAWTTDPAQDGFYTAWDADAAAFFSHFATDPGRAVKVAWNAWVLDGKAHGWWSPLGAIMRATHEPVSSLVNIKNPAQSFAASGGPAFTPYEGYAGDGVDAQITWPAASAIPGWTQNDNLLGVDVSVAAGTGILVGAASSSGQRLLYNPKGSTTAQARAGNSVNVNATPAPTSRGGVSGVLRRSNSELKFFEDGAVYSTVASTSDGTSAQAVTLFRQTTVYATDKVRGMWMGASLTDEQLAAFHTDWNDLTSALTAAAAQPFVSDLYVLSAFIPSNKTLEMQVAYVFGSGAYSDYSATRLVNTATDGSGGNPLPGDPGTGGGDTSGGGTQQPF